MIGRMDLDNRRGGITGRCTLAWGVIEKSGSQEPASNTFEEGTVVAVRIRE